MIPTRASRFNCLIMIFGDSAQVAFYQVKSSDLESERRNWQLRHTHSSVCHVHCAYHKIWDFRLLSQLQVCPHLPQWTPARFSQTLTWQVIPNRLFHLFVNLVKATTNQPSAYQRRPLAKIARDHSHPVVQDKSSPLLTDWDRAGRGFSSQTALAVNWWESSATPRWPRTQIPAQKTEDIPPASVHTCVSLGGQSGQSPPRHRMCINHKFWTRTCPAYLRLAKDKSREGNGTAGSQTQKDTCTWARARPVRYHDKTWLWNHNAHRRWTRKC